MSDQDEWCPIESDPGVFTELIRGFGVAGQVEELYSLDPISYMEFKPVHGLIFLFKVVNEDYSDGVLLKDEKILSKLFYAKQVIKNACGTQALINILMNCNHEDLKLGKTLSDFKEFTSRLDSHQKGVSLMNAERVRVVNNSFARTPKELDVNKDSDHHFLGYIPFSGRLIELDGRKEGPYDLGPIPEGTDWVATARLHIEKRISKYGDGEIGFNLMALVSDQKMVYTRRIAELQAKGTTEDAQLLIEHLKMLIAEEEAKMKRYKVENIRRKHNYLPLIVDILTALAEEGKLVEQYDKAKNKSIQLANLKKSAK